MGELDFCGLAALQANALCECLDAAGLDARIAASGRGPDVDAAWPGCNGSVIDD